MAHVLSTCTSLVHLNLGFNRLQEGAVAVMAALGGCSLLAELMLARNLIGLSGASAVAKWLGFRKPPLALLDLAGNDMRDDGVCILAGELAVCGGTLEHLILSSNEMGDPGCDLLAQVVGQCQSLRTLDLFDNEVGQRGAEFLGETLVGCSSLTKLNLSDNELECGGARRVPSPHVPQL